MFLAIIKQYSVGWLVINLSKIRFSYVFFGVDKNSEYHFSYIFTNLVRLRLSHYNAQGPIDISIFSHLKWLEVLDLFYLNTTTTIDLNDILSYFKWLRWLDLSGNHVSATNKSPVSDLPLLYKLHLSGCSITEFPEFVKSQNIERLDISNNKIKGQVPGWLWTLSNLYYLDISNNSFTGFKNAKKHGLSLMTLLASIPRSLIRFSSLEVLNVESNMINDTFPFWLRYLPELKILVLRSNAFHGPMHQTSFPKLQIIDISHNHFNGALPSDYFVKWIAMSSLGTVSDQPDEMYMGYYYYQDSMVLMNKGLEMELVRILKIFRALDFSGNKFEGDIPRSIGQLKELHVLNFSNNAFTGHIPSSLGSLTALESLDVSQNQLSGEIPQELGSLSFLSYMNFSHNQLCGLVPGGTQFRRQNCTSFEGNMGLSGPSLDEICRDIHASTPHETPESEEEEEEEEEVLTWIAAVKGVIPGIAFGWVIGYILVSYKPEWFMNPFVQSNEDAAATQLIKEVFDNLPEESERRNPKQPPCPNLD